MVDDRFPRSGFDELVGVEWITDDPDGARARFEVGADHLQPFGIVHGGAFSTLVESVCSHATSVALLGQELAAMGQSINVSFLRPVTEGHAEVLARARHRGRTTWVWEAEIRDSADRLCALAQMTIAVRPIPRSDS
jgi:uncharacterized protein (TIGR00369 family)